jgi:DNA-binding CsgD family transcriptional regulator
MSRIETAGGAEILYEDSKVDRRISLRRGWTLSGNGAETQQPALASSGFRDIATRNTAVRQVPATNIIGRHAELEEMRAVLDASLNGDKSVLVVRGEPGVGKTSLVDAFVASVPADVRVFRTEGVESEADLGYAGLHRLLRPLLLLADALPTPQRSALNTAFGLADGAPPHRLHAGLAALSLLAEIAAASPTLCVIDDAHWLDPESLDALAFVARRLYADPVAMVFVVREAVPPPLQGFPVLPLKGLTEADATAVLNRLFPRPFGPAVASRIVTETGGNPLALHELARTFSADQLNGHAAQPRPLPIASILEDRFAQRFLRLPAQTQRLLVVLAADQRVDRHALAGAAARLGLELGALDAAENAGLIAVGDDIRFCHPLVRSACYRAANQTHRRQAHHALAETLDAERDVERRAWHLALGAVTADEGIASALVAAASKAGDRGAKRLQVELLSRAAELTPDSEQRGRRFLQAAGAATLFADTERVIALVDRARSCTNDRLRLAQAMHVEALAPAFRRRFGQSPRLLLNAARALDEFDRDKARAVALESWFMLGTAKGQADGLTAREFALEVKCMPRVNTGEPTIVDLLLDGYATVILDGWEAGASPLLEAIRRWPKDVSSAEAVHRHMGPPVWAALSLWDYDGLRRVVEHQVAMTRAAGALNPLLCALVFQLRLQTLTGALDDADSTALEIDDLMTMMDGTNEWHCLATAETHAWRGHHADAQAAIVQLHHLADTEGLGLATQIAHLSAAVLANGSRQYSEAASAATSIVDDHASECSSNALVELAEALAHLDDAHRLPCVLAQIDERAKASGTNVARGISARAHALANTGQRAEELYREAIDLLTTTSAASDLARSHLVYGEWLRRENRRTEARQQLRAAHQQLSDIGAEAFAERARNELEATGERARRREVSTLTDLTPQERQVGTLAARGLTNKEIANELYISSRTVDYHLRKVFRKLGVESRRQLAKTHLGLVRSPSGGDHG